MRAVVPSVATAGILAATTTIGVAACFALILATVFLGERPDGWTPIGAALIVASGLYTLARTNRSRG